MRKEAHIATALLGHSAKRVTPVFGGGNNRVFRVESSCGFYALKLYAAADGSGAERFTRETRALSFLATGPLADCVPKLMASDPTSCAALLEWVEGDFAGERSESDIAQLQQVVHLLQAVSKAPEAVAFPPATEACLCPEDIADQVDRRRDRLAKQADEPSLTPFLAKFDAIWPRVRDPLLWQREQGPLVLSPSDFGFHNALRRPNGRLVFLDFEYFGWDDPVRLVADLLWHPGMTLSPAEAQAIRNTAQAVFATTDGMFAQRFARAWPAIGLRWSLILLNAFLPERWQRRQSAAHGEPQGELVSLAAHKAVQLRKAETWLRRVEECLHEVAA